MCKHAIPFIAHLTRTAGNQQCFPMPGCFIQQRRADRFCGLRLALAKQAVGLLEATLEIGVHTHRVVEAAVR